MQMLALVVSLWECIILACFRFLHRRFYALLYAPTSPITQDENTQDMSVYKRTLSSIHYSFTPQSSHSVHLVFSTLHGVVNFTVLIAQPICTLRTNRETHPATRKHDSPRNYGSTSRGTSPIPRSITQRIQIQANLLHQRHGTHHRDSPLLPTQSTHAGGTQGHTI